MSCKNCEKLKEEILKSKNNITYVRIETSNIAIIGCRQHLKELLEQLKKAKKNEKPRAATSTWDNF